MKIISSFIAVLISGLFAGQAIVCSQEQQAPATPELSGKLYLAKPGPWGNLQYYYIYLEAPSDFVERFPLPNSIPRWSFPGHKPEDVREIFERAGVAKALQDYLLDDKNYVLENDILTVFPPLPDLEAMSQEQREVLYTELAKYPINEFYVEPVLIPSGDTKDWLKGTRLRPELCEVIDRLTYMRGDMLVFSDLAAVLNYTRSTEEAKDFFKTMTRTRTMVLRLQVNENDDTEALANYWTGRKRFKDILPVLSSVTETEGVTALDVVHLLPSMARRYLYTYPPVDLAMRGRMPDCHWTSLNFFNHWAREYYLDSRLAASAVIEDYEQVSDEKQFGDVLMFMDGNSGNAIHSCVYIADDIVFTKNGENMVAPWLLMRLDDVRRIYFHAKKGRILTYRLKRVE